MIFFVVLQSYNIFTGKALPPGIFKFQNSSPSPSPSPTGKTPTSPEDIQKQVAQFYNIRTQDMKSKVRKRNIAYPRQVAMYLCKELTKHSMPEIAERFEKKDHTTILYAYRKIQEERAQDANFDDEITRLIKLLKQQ